MKNLIFVSLLSALAANGFAQSQINYDTAVSKFKRFYNQHNSDSVFNLFSPRIQEMMPKDKTSEMVTELNSQLGEMQSFEFSRQDTHLWYYKTEFAHSPLTLILALNENNKLETFRFMPYEPDTAKKNTQETSNLVLKTPSGSVYGTLSVPSLAHKMPVVLIIAGSGPTDRNGNSPMGIKADVYRLIADSLNQAGIACARYDKRGIGESASAVKDEESISFDDLVNDAVGFIKLLKADQRFSKVIVLGHSEGSLMGMVAAEKEKINGFISVAGIAERADKIIEKQISTQSAEMAGKSKIILDSLDKGYQVKNIDPSLNSLFRASVQHYMISWLRYTPEKEIKKLNIPVMLVQGTTDLQVSEEEAYKLKKAAPKATLKIVKGMNHILKEAPMDRKQNLATYTNPDLPLSPQLMHILEAFIQSIK